MKKVMLHNSAIMHTVKSNYPPKQISHKNSFAQVLNNIIDKDQNIKFSKHALQRLQTRKIKLEQSEMMKIHKALNKAKEKGIKETLILMDNKAFVASVQNKTIITVALEEQLKENIFTNIDGAVII